MNFLQVEYLLPVLLFLLVVIFVSIKQENSFYKWIENHWFMKRSKKNKMSSVFYYIGLTLISLALLDLRGPEENITGKVSDQKTIILIDSSASMMAEDVRPNRFNKALLLAKHYVRKAIGQQISVVVFSDSTKQIVPFTNDMDLVDARLGALENMDLKRGGTGLSLAIKESIQYFSNHTKDVSGNILLFTDAEETEGGFELNIPQNISVGVIGVGTAKGAPVPMRNSRGVFIGNKKYNREVVISKLDEAFLKKLGSKVRDFRYWIASSYSLPTEEILKFFEKIHKVRQSKNNFRIRPVLSNYLMAPGVFFFILSFLLKNMNTFAYLCIGLITFSTYAQQVPKEVKEPVKSEEVKELEEQFSKGEIREKDKSYLASELLKQGFPEEAEKLYKEIIENKKNKVSDKEKFNYGAAQLKNKNIGGGLKTYQDLYKNLKKSNANPELLESVKANIIKALENMSSASQKKKNKKDDEQDEKDKDKKDQSGEGDSESKDNKDKQSDKSEGQKKKSDKDSDKKDKQKNKDQQNKDKDKDKDKEKKDNQSDKDKEKKKKQEKKNKKGSGGKPNKPKKMPAILKQLMSDDNKLQKKMIDTGTTKRKSREKRDW